MLMIFTDGNLFMILQVVLSTLLFTALKYILPLKHTVPLVITDLTLINLVFIFYTIKVKQFLLITIVGYLLVIVVLLMRLITTSRGVF